MEFLKKKYRPWSFQWVVQRFVALVRERRLPQLPAGSLLKDYRHTRRLNAKLKTAGANIDLQQDNFGDEFFNFIPSIEYQPFVINEDADANALSCLNTLFDHVYVLNLGRRIDRRIEMIQKLKKYRIQAEIIPAVDGYTPENQAEFYEYYRKPIGAKGSHPLEHALRKKLLASPGAWGYLKTWQNVIEDAKKNNYRNFVCFDDDILFHNEFETRLEAAMEMLPDDWKVIYLGASQYLWNVPEHLDNPLAFKDKISEAPFYHPLRTDGSFAMVIDASVFDELLQQIAPMNCAFDSGPLRAILEKYNRRCFVLTPNLVIADVKQSDIMVDRQQEQMATKVRWNLGDYDYPFRKELVSVIMPAFNAEKTIEKSIRSILLQNYKELEIIVGDDGSTDRTGEIVERLAKEDIRVKLVRLGKNQGCYPARNAALRVSIGKYIAIQDSDDISLASRLETQLVPLLLGKAQFTVARIFRSRCSVEELDISNQKEMIRTVLGKREKNAAGNYEYHDRPVIGFMTSMFTREMFETYGLFWENRFGADAEILERALFLKSGILLDKEDGTIHSYLMERKSIPGLYERIDKVLLISLEMTADNITNRHSRQEKEAFQEQWRKKFTGEEDYIYPKL